MSGASRAWMSSLGARPLSLQNASALPMRPVTAPRVWRQERTVAACRDTGMTCSLLVLEPEGFQLLAHFVQVESELTRREAFALRLFAVDALLRSLGDDRG